MYCRNCGHPLQDSSCSYCSAPSGQGTSYCPHCGQPTQVGASVCSSCGQPLVLSKSSPTETKSSPKSKLAAGLLGIFLGSFGIHNFYLGYNKRGLVQLLLTVLSCGLFSFATEIWGAVEGILILCNEHPTDAKGIPLKD